MGSRIRLGLAILVLSLLRLGVPAPAEPIGPPDVERIDTQLSFSTLLSRLDHAVVSNGLTIVTEYSGSSAAAAHGVKLRGSTVVMVSRDELVLRVLQADTDAGVEVPLRFYVTENANGTASLTYRKPSDIFAPYLDKHLDQIAADLDDLFAKIVKQATKG